MTLVPPADRDTVAAVVSPLPTPAGPRRRRQRRIVLWSGLAVLVVFAVLLAFLATVGSTKANSRLLGRPAPAVQGRELATGQPLALSDFAGRWVLVNFAASWCIPCQQEMPQLQVFDRSARRYDATILSVTYDPNDTSGLRTLFRGDHATWPAVADAAADVTWGVHGGIPQSFLVAPDGLVVAYFPSGVDAATLDSTITQLSSGRPASTNS